MAKREIIEIDEEKCDGCGICIPNCPEGALQIIDGKARLVSDLLCDGLGACIGHCPKDAITITKRDAKSYDERKVMANIVKQGENTLKAHLHHLAEHNQTKFLNQAINYLKENNLKIPDYQKNDVLPCGCSGSTLQTIEKKHHKKTFKSSNESELAQWPIQLNLLPPHAPFFNNSNLLIAADCVGFVDPNLHQDFLRGKSVAIGCPKLDDVSAYKEKIQAIIEQNNIKKVTAAIMEVPCCTGLYHAVEQAVEDSKKNVPIEKVIVKIDGAIEK
ncbi:4Fe-4S binding protein [Candidatus Woesearchaeota archaeon]|nr:4Fe-4S binding protein [Candidatus Woesearchaeota archaeon]